MNKPQAKLTFSDGILGCEVYDRKGWYNYAIDLIPLEPEEKYGGGRFAYFTEDEGLPYSVKLGFSPTIFADWIEWIAENVRNPWSIVPQVPDHIHGGLKLTFQFADQTEGVQFLLTWS